MWIGLDRGAWDTTVSVPYQQQLAMLDGLAHTEGELALIREQVVAERIASGIDAMTPTVEALEALGAEVVSWPAQTGTVRVRLPGGELVGFLEAHPEVIRVEEYQPEREDASGYAMSVSDTLDGEETADLLQSNLYYAKGYYGRTTDEISVVESAAGSMRTNHLSFRDGAGTSRMVICAGTSPTSCNYISTSGPGGPHTVKVTSILLSDLTLGQDPAFATASDRAKRSGVARRSKGVAMTSDDPQRVVDLMSADPDVFVLSRSASQADVGCLGAGALSKQWNTMFENGIALFNSTGNNGHADAGTCTVNEPATAIGVMAVGAYKVNGTTDELYVGTDRGGGGTTGDAGGRTLIAAIAPSAHKYRAEDDPAANPQYAEAGFCCTSSSTPSMAGAATLYRDWYRTALGTAIDEPGRLYASLLLMGDRTQQVGGYLSSGFDNVGGSGKLRLRMYGSGGVDNPAGYASGAVCVGAGQTVYQSINNGAALPAAVDYVKAVAWWYDHDHDSDVNGYPDPGVDFDKIRLKLQKQVAGVWTDVVTSDLDDNRQRVYATGAGGSIYRLELYGRDVLGADHGCGASANLVYLARTYEDNARDDGGDLTTYIRPEP
ncbi:MAG: hypothetical protein ABMA64_05320 [Myxococcota bacterium]